MIKKFQFKKNHKNSHKTDIHFAIYYSTEQNIWVIDEDGTDHWIRSLFSPECQTWCYDCGQYVPDNKVHVQRAYRQLNTMFKSQERINNAEHKNN